MGKILIVDDEKEIVSAIKEELEYRSFSVKVAFSGKEAIDIVSSENDIDVMVTDLRMPEISGIELIRIIRQKSEDTQCIVITGNKDIDTAVEAMKLGAINYIAKPFGIDELDVAIKKGLEKLELIRSVREKQKALEEANKELEKANQELMMHRDHLENLVEEEIIKRRASDQNLYLYAIADVMSIALYYWQHATSMTKIDLVEKCDGKRRVWTISPDSDSPRARTFDKYLSKNKIPKNPRYDNVIDTVNFILSFVPDEKEPEIRKELEEKMKDLDTIREKVN